MAGILSVIMWLCPWSRRNFCLTLVIRSIWRTQQRALSAHITKANIGHFRGWHHSRWIRLVLPGLYLCCSLLSGSSSGWFHHQNNTSFCPGTFRFDDFTCGSAACSCCLADWRLHWKELVKKSVLLKTASHPVKEWWILCALCLLSLSRSVMSVSMEKNTHGARLDSYKEQRMRECVQGWRFPELRVEPQPPRTRRVMSHCWNFSFQYLEIFRCSGNDGIDSQHRSELQLIIDPFIYTHIWVIHKYFLILFEVIYECLFVFQIFSYIFR